MQNFLTVKSSNGRNFLWLVQQMAILIQISFILLAQLYREHHNNVSKGRIWISTWLFKLHLFEIKQHIPHKPVLSHHWFCLYFHISNVNETLWVCCENAINFCLLNHTDFSSLHSRCPMLKYFSYPQWASFSWHKSSPQPHCFLNIPQNLLYSFQGNSTPSPYKVFLLCTWKKKKNICSSRTTLFFPPLFMENLLSQPK